MKIKFTQIFKICLLLVFSGISVTGFTQTQISGKVTNSKDKSPLQGISVKVKNAALATKTDATGTFNITIPSPGAVLIFTSVGFETQQVAAIDATINVSLVESATQLQDVVVIAYGTSRKKDLVGSVVALGPKDFQKGVINSSEQLLQGKVAGLEITTGGGAAGGGSKIRIRGSSSLNASNDPLIVIDGVPVDNNNAPGSANLLNTINPNDIESISVLKDVASTVLYGSRATNGVLIITTKKGTGGKTRYNFNTKYSVGEVKDYIKVLSGDEVRAIINADALSSGSNLYKNQLGTENTNWQTLIYQKAIGVENNISASGTYRAANGSFRLPFRASVGYLNQTGVLRTNKFDRVTAAFNLTPKFLNDNLAITVSTKFADTKNRFANEGAIGNAVSFDPTQAVYANTKFKGFNEYLKDGRPNPLAPKNPLGLLENKFDIGYVDRAIGNVQADYRLHFFPDLHIIVNAAIDYTKTFGYNTVDSLSAEAYDVKGSYSNYKASKLNTLLEQSLFYSKEIPSIKSKVDVLALHSYQNFNSKYNNYPSYTGVTITQPTFPFDRQQNRLESLLGRVNYTYNNKYLITASVRRDVSSRFSPKDRVIVSPGVAAAWKLKEEFFKNTKAVSELKLRGSWGRIGNQDISDNYAYIPRYTLSTNTAQYQLGNNYYQLLRPVRYDENVKWETLESYNVGLDFGFINNRISGSVEAYQKKTSNLLSVVPVPSGANFDVELLTNVGNIENKGLEATLNIIPIQSKNITWDIGVNGSYNESIITNLLRYDDPTFKGLPVNGISGGLGNKISRQAIGYAPFTYYTYKQVYDAGGSPIQGLYEDVNRDGVVDSKDLILDKHPNPDFLFGINTNFSINRWTVSAAAHGAAGNYVYNNFKSNNGALTSIKNNLLYIANASQSYTETKFTQPQYLSDYYVQNASFLRLDNINLGYNFGKIGRGNSTLRLAASIQNVAFITKYKGVDPESAGTGVDNTIYPRPRTYSFGANIDF